MLQAETPTYSRTYTRSPDLRQPPRLFGSRLSENALLDCSWMTSFDWLTLTLCPLLEIFHSLLPHAGNTIYIGPPPSLFRFFFVGHQQ